MNEEEKQAIEVIKGLYICYDDDLLDEKEIKENEQVNNSINIILNLLEKQQKEIEDLKNDHIDFWINTKEVEDMVRGKFINKDKIKEKIKEIDKAYEDSKNECGESEYYYPGYTVDILKELLGE